MISVVLTVVLFSTLGGIHAIVMHVQWGFVWFSITLLCAAPTADLGFCSFGTSPPARSVFRGTIGGPILLCVLGIDKEPSK